MNSRTSKPSSPSKGEIDLVAQLAIDLSEEREARLAAEAKVEELKKELGLADKQAHGHGRQSGSVPGGMTYVYVNLLYALCRPLSPSSCALAFSLTKFLHDSAEKDQKGALRHCCNKWESSRKRGN